MSRTRLFARVHGATRGPLRGVTAAALLVVGAAAVPGCGGSGYQFGQAYDTQIRTVAVPLFANDTYAPEIDRALTEAIIREIHTTTPWRVVPADSADAVLTGRVTNAELRKLATDRRTGLVAELAYELTVSYEWKDVRSGDVLAAYRNVRAAEPFAPAAGGGERIGVGQRGTVNELAREIVSDLRSAW